MKISIKNHLSDFYAPFLLIDDMNADIIHIQIDSHDREGREADG